MKKATQLALSFAAFSALAACAGYLANRRGLLTFRRPAAPDIAVASEADPLPAQEPQEPAKKTFRSGQLQADAPREDPLDGASPIFEFQLVETEEIKA